MIALYLVIYLIIGLFLVTIFCYAMDGPSNDSTYLDGGTILLIVGWPITIAALLVFSIIYGIWSAARAIGVAIYNWSWR